MSHASEKGPISEEKSNAFNINTSHEYKKRNSTLRWIRLRLLPYTFQPVTAAKGTFALKFKEIKGTLCRVPSM